MDRYTPTVAKQNSSISQRNSAKDMGNERESSSNSPQLPDHLVMEVLNRVPAALLVKNFRTVCKSWLHYMSTADFIMHNSSRSKQELLIQDPVCDDTSRFTTKSLEMDEKELSFKLNYDYTPPMPLSMFYFFSIPKHWSGFRPTTGRISCSYNGVLLINTALEDGWLYLINFLTKSIIILPRCPSNCPHETCGSALGFDPRTKQYKVVHIYTAGFGVEIFSLANNAWKVLPGPFPEDCQLDARPYHAPKFHWDDPVIIDGRYMHWYVESDRFLISMDVSDEQLVRTDLPNYGFGMDKDAYALLDLGGQLSCIANVSDTKIDVWILEDFRKHEWIKKHSILAEEVNYINLKAQPSMSKLIALAALRNGQVIMFKHKQEKAFMYLYEIKSRKMKQFKMPMKNGQRFVLHRNSLMSLKTDDLVLNRT